METLIGFLVGYVVGSRQGREGLARTVESLRAIAGSPEVRGLISTGMSAVAGLASQKGAAAGTLGSALADSIRGRAKRLVGSRPELRAV